MSMCVHTSSYLQYLSHRNTVFLSWSESNVHSDTIDNPLRLMTEGQPRADEAPSRLRWYFAQLQVHGTARLAHAHMISSSSIGQHKPRSMFQDLACKTSKKKKQWKSGQVVIRWGRNVIISPSIKWYGELAFITANCRSAVFPVQMTAQITPLQAQCHPCPEGLKVSTHGSLCTHGVT